MNTQANNRCFAALVAWAASLAVCVATSCSEEPRGPARDWRAGRSVEPWPLPAFEVTDHNGQTLQRGDLIGRVWVAELLSLHCGSCAPLSDSFRILQQRLPESVGFLSLGLDLGDGPSVLRSHQTRHPHVDRARWRMSVADLDFAPRLAVALGAARTRQRYLEGLLELTPRLYLLDANANVVAAYDPAVAADLERLVTHALSLASAAQTPHSK